MYVRTYIRICCICVCTLQCAALTHYRILISVAVFLPNLSHTQDWYKVVRDGSRTYGRVEDICLEYRILTAHL
jgi:hypothetical protein